jgi:hypothetical protein
MIRGASKQNQLPFIHVFGPEKNNYPCTEKQVFIAHYC